jgi:hypothetical protein
MEFTCVWMDFDLTSVLKGNLSATLITCKHLGFHNGRNIYSVITPQKTTILLITHYLVKLASETFTLLEVAHNLNCYTETTE